MTPEKLAALRARYPNDKRDEIRDPPLVIGAGAEITDDGNGPLRRGSYRIRGSRLKQRCGQAQDSESREGTGPNHWQMRPFFGRVPFSRYSSTAPSTQPLPSP